MGLNLVPVVLVQLESFEEQQRLLLRPVPRRRRGRRALQRRVPAIVLQKSWRVLPHRMKTATTAERSWLLQSWRVNIGFKENRQFLAKKIGKNRRNNDLKMLQQQQPLMYVRKSLSSPQRCNCQCLHGYNFFALYLIGPESKVGSKIRLLFRIFRRSVDSRFTAGSLQLAVLKKMETKFL
jgi:hypothetical protein